MKKADKELLEPHMKSLLTKINKLIKEHGLKGFSVKELSFSRNLTDPKQGCPCGTEHIMLSSGKIVIRCKRCPPDA